MFLQELEDTKSSRRSSCRSHWGRAEVHPGVALTDVVCRVNWYQACGSSHPAVVSAPAVVPVAGVGGNWRRLDAGMVARAADGADAGVCARRGGISRLTHALLRSEAPRRRRGQVDSGASPQRLILMGIIPFQAACQRFLPTILCRAGLFELKYPEITH